MFREILISTFFIATLLELPLQCPAAGSCCYLSLLRRHGDGTGRDVGRIVGGMGQNKYLAGTCGHPALVVLRLRGGEDEEKDSSAEGGLGVKALQSQADWSTSTPEGDEELEDMTQSSLDLSAPVPSSNSSETSEPESQASTGLGIHQHNWTRIETIGIPVFEFPEYDKVAKEAKVLKRAREAAVGAQEWKMAEREKMKKETLQRQWTRDDGKAQGLFASSEMDKEITGEPCKVCGKILCYCQYFKEQEAMRKRGFVDPWERMKDRHILQPGQDVLPSSSTPEEDIEFWNKCIKHEEYEDPADDEIECVDASNLDQTIKRMGYKHIPDGLTPQERSREKKVLEARKARNTEKRRAEFVRRATKDDDDDGFTIQKGSADSEESVTVRGERSDEGDEESVEGTSSEEQAKDSDDKNEYMQYQKVIGEVKSGGPLETSDQNAFTEDRQGASQRMRAAGKGFVRSKGRRGGTQKDSEQGEIDSQDKKLRRGKRQREACSSSECLGGHTIGKTGDGFETKREVSGSSPDTQQERSSQDQNGKAVRKRRPTAGFSGVTEEESSSEQQAKRSTRRVAVSEGTKTRSQQARKRSKAEHGRLSRTADGNVPTSDVSGGVGAGLVLDEGIVSSDSVIGAELLEREIERIGPLAEKSPKRRLRKAPSGIDLLERELEGTETERVMSLRKIPRMLAHHSGSGVKGWKELVCRGNGPHQRIIDNYVIKGTSSDEQEEVSFSSHSTAMKMRISLKNGSDEPGDHVLEAKSEGQGESRGVGQGESPSSASRRGYGKSPSVQPNSREDKRRRGPDDSSRSKGPAKRVQECTESRIALDLDVESSMDDDEYRDRQRKTMREDIEKEIARVTAPTHKRVFFGKGDKKGVKVSMIEPEPWIQEFIGEKARKRVRNAGEKKGEFDEDQ